MASSRRAGSGTIPSPQLDGVEPRSKQRGSIFASEETRLVVMTRLLGVSVLSCLAFSWKLWVSRSTYPFVPLWGLFPGFPYPFDYVFLGLLVAVLVAVVIQPRSKIWIAMALAALAVLFVQDQNRLWPSFYQFFLLLLLLITFRRQQGEKDAHRVLSGMRFVMAAVYFWGGVQKLNWHFFNEEFPWFVEPLTSLLPIEIPYLPAIGVLAALFEILFGIGLLTDRFRNIALFEALLMHALILFCIGPLRDNWNNSSWIWSQTVAVQVWVLFYRAPPFKIKEMFRAPLFFNLPQAAAVVLIGILPVLNNVNLWDSALSFNVYTGNVNYAEIHMSPEAASQLPNEMAAFVTVEPNRAILSLNEWTLHEFNANPYPETRIFQAVLERVCSYVADEPVYLFVLEKSGWFFSKTKHQYECAEQ